MEKIEYFFRGLKSDYVFPVFSTFHYGILILAFIGLLVIYRHQDIFVQKKKIIKIIAIILLIQQVLMYGWYLASGYFSWQESLPLYNCRIAIISLILAELLGWRKLRSLSLYWGFMGAIIALIYPVLDPFGLDHYSFYSFFIGHLFLLWGSYIYILDESLILSRSNMNKIVIFTSIYHVIMIPINKLLLANYCYLDHPPLLNDLASKLPLIIYQVIFISLFNLGLITLFYNFNFLRKKNKRKYCTI